MKKYMIAVPALILLICMLFVKTPLPAAKTGSTLSVCDDQGQVLREFQTGIDRGTSLKIKLFHAGDPSKLYTAYQKKGLSKSESLDRICAGLGKALLAFLEKQIVLPEDARLEFLPKTEQIFNYHAESNGKKADIDDALDRAASMLKSGGSLILNYIRLSPKMTIDALKQKTQRLSSYTTYFSDSTPERKHNIQTAAAFFDGLVIAPGQTLSFNETAKKRTEENGYLSAKVIENGEYVDGIGGGVCQVSTTLYNAWLCAGLAVQESRSHTIPAKYVPIARDAAVSEFIDLLLKNDSADEIYIKAVATDEKVTFMLFGTSRGIEVKLINTLVKVIPPPPNLRVGEGEYLISSTDGKSGFLYRSYQYFYQGESLLEERFIRNTYYAPKAGVDEYAEMPPADDDITKPSFPLIKGENAL